MNINNATVLNTNPTIINISSLSISIIDAILNFAGAPVFKICGIILDGNPVNTKNIGPANAPTIAISVYPIIDIDTSATISIFHYSNKKFDTRHGISRCQKSQSHIRIINICYQNNKFKNIKYHTSQKV